MSSGQRRRIDGVVQGVGAGGPVGPVEPVGAVGPAGPLAPVGAVAPPGPVGPDCAKIAVGSCADATPIAAAITVPAAKRTTKLRSRTDNER
jgi:hypothetical protein